MDSSSSSNARVGCRLRPPMPRRVDSVPLRCAAAGDAGGTLPAPERSPHGRAERGAAARRPGRWRCPGGPRRSARHCKARARASLRRQVSLLQPRRPSQRPPSRLTSPGATHAAAVESIAAAPATGRRERPARRARFPDRSQHRQCGTVAGGRRQPRAARRSRRSRPARSRGTGFFVAPDRVLTNAHVVEGQSSVQLQVGAATYTARVAADVAGHRPGHPRGRQRRIRRSRCCRLGTATTARVGQEVIAIGSALGVLSNTVTRGIVSAVRQVGAVTLIQTDAAINPGNSGGPLVDRDGRRDRHQLDGRRRPALRTAWRSRSPSITPLALLSGRVDSSRTDAAGRAEPGDGRDQRQRPASAPPDNSATSRRSSRRPARATSSIPCGCATPRSAWRHGPSPPTVRGSGSSTPMPYGSPAPRSTTARAGLAPSRGHALQLREDVESARKPRAALASIPA